MLATRQRGGESVEEHAGDFTCVLACAHIGPPRLQLIHDQPAVGLELRDHRRQLSVVGGESQAEGILRLILVNHELAAEPNRSQEYNGKCGSDRRDDGRPRHQPMLIARPLSGLGMPEDAQVFQQRRQLMASRPGHPARGDRVKP